MTGQSAVPDYISIILRAIEKTKNDPAQLRQLIYDVARIGLGKQVLLNYRELGSEGLQQHLSDLEVAIRKVEIIAHLETEVLPPGSHIPLIEGPASSANHSSMIVRDQFDDAHVGEYWRDDSTVIARAARPQIYADDATRSEVLPSIQVWEPALPKSPKRDPDYRFHRFELPIAVLIGMAIYAILLVRSDYFGEPSIFQRGQVAQSAVLSMTSTASTASSLVGPPGEKPDFPLPSIYGVYALSEGKLYELEPLAMRVPDPRVAISAMISSPSQVTIPNGKLAFIIYRRDLVSSAPDNVSVRIVARVMRELKFSGAGPPKLVQVTGEWAIRSKAFQFGVAPLKDNPEMIMLRPQTSQFSLSPGRYALVLGGRGYDFGVAGPMTDPAQCLERTDALGGMIYSECPSAPSAQAH